MAKKSTGLGRGLDSLLPSSLPSSKPAASGSPAGINEIPVNQIEVNQFQPRNKFDEEALKQLADSIEIHGIIQPLTVRKLSDKEYQLIAGERRLRASKIAGLKKVPAYIRTANDEQMLEMALIENIQREDLDPMEIANSYQRMISELGLIQEDLAKKVGKKRASVANYIRLLKLPVEIQAALKEKNKEKKISFGHARTLISIEDSRKQLDIYEKILAKGLSVRQTEDLVRELSNSKPEKEKKAEEKDKNRIHLDALEKKLEEKFGNRVSLAQKKDGKGEIKVAFSSNDDLTRILEILDI